MLKGVVHSLPEGSPTNVFLLLTQSTLQWLCGRDTSG